MLHSPISKKCLKCNNEYGNDEFFCYKCFICPECNSDLTTFPLAYKTTNDGKFALIKSKDDKSKIVGKAVHFRCKKYSADCDFKFTTKVETKPQTLQEIVLNNVNEFEDSRFHELDKYFDWKLNYYRILDKKQRIKWKTEILKKFSSFEITQILKTNYHYNDISNKEESMIIDIDKVEKLQDLRLFPSPKPLHVQMSNICTNCFTDISSTHLIEKVPLVYCVPMVKYPSKLIHELKDDELKIPILVNFINESKDSLIIHILPDTETNLITNESITIELLPSDDIDGFGKVPTSLLSHTKNGEWKDELFTRSDNFCKLEYNPSIVENDEFEIVEKGVNWITLIAIVKATAENRDGKIKFPLNLDIESNKNGLSNLVFHCTALV